VSPPFLAGGSRSQIGAARFVSTILVSGAKRRAQDGWWGLGG